jgi:1-acyl-sn-glycerol-3-phosphate acyltransferase
MNINPIEKRYEFCPPRHAQWFRPICHLLSSAFLRCKFNIRHLTVHGDAPLAELIRTGQSVLVAPSHADHADPSLLIQVGRRHGFSFHFMAAREGFERGKLDRFVLQRSGAFSVDRDGADLAAIRTAMSILRECSHPLVIFPEGEIYHHHEELDLLNEGVATILLRSAGKLPSGKKSYAVPAAIRIRHDPSVAHTFSPRLDTLEKRITWKPRPHLEVVQRIYSLGSALLSIKEEEFMGASRKGDLAERIQYLQQYLVAEAEQRHGLTAVSGSVPERLKALRHVIRNQLLDDPAKLPAVRRAALHHDLDRLFAAQQLYSYPARYLSGRPSLDRIAETIFKLEEDVLDRGTYPAPRRAEICFGAPIDVAEFLNANFLNAKSGVRPITELLREKIDSLLKGEPDVGTTLSPANPFP